MSETAFLATSDYHAGKRTETYDLGKLERSLDLMVEALQEIRERQAGVDFDRLVFAILGDAPDGADVYPTQVYHQEITDPTEQAELLVDLLAPRIGTLDGLYGKLSVITRLGNHGRVSKRHAERTNYDVFFYQFLRERLAPQGIEVQLGEGPAASAEVLTIRGHRYLPIHGHQFKSGGAATPLSTIINRVDRWQSTSLGPLDAVVMGHFHQSAVAQVNGYRVMLTGTPVTGDEWLLMGSGRENINRWRFFGISDRRPVTFEYEIDLVEPKVRG